MYILRMVLNSGSVTEMMFDNELSMNDACEAFSRTAVAVDIPDDYGHTVRAEPNQIAALIRVDLKMELKGHAAVTYERQMMQDRLQERVHKTRELVSAPTIAPARSNGSSPIIFRG